MPNAIAPALRHAFSLKVSSPGAPSRGGTLGSRAVKLIPTMKLIRPPPPPRFQNFICSSTEGSGGVQPRHGRPPPTQPPVRPQSCRGKRRRAQKGFDVFIFFFFFFLQGQPARASASRAARPCFFFFLSSFADDEPKSMYDARSPWQQGPVVVFLIPLHGIQPLHSQNESTDELLFVSPHVRRFLLSGFKFTPPASSNRSENFWPDMSVSFPMNEESPSLTYFAGGFKKKKRCLRKTHTVLKSHTL